MPLTPHSSLEEENVDSVTDGGNYTPDTDPTRRYSLRGRKTVSPVRHSNKPLRENRTVVNYSSLLNDRETDPPSPKREKPKPSVPKEPSKERIAAQQQIIENDFPKGRPPRPQIVRKTFATKDPSRSKPSHRRDIKTEVQTAQKDLTNTEPIPSNTLRGAFETVDHRLKKYKQERYFKCPVCDIHKGTTSRLNDHFKRRHPPLSCDECTQTFSTPSGLARHKYSHSDPRHKCDDCEQSFYFAGELKQHRVTHLKTRMHICNYGNCTKSYMNKPDLLKHVRTHTNPILHCKVCDYTSHDKRLLQSHLISHSDEQPYSCEKCNFKCKYRMQLKRHKEDHTVEVVRSKSPEF